MAADVAMALMRRKASALEGWRCSRPDVAGYGFHADPVEGCPGEHLPLYSWPEDYIALAIENAAARRVL